MNIKNNLVLEDIFLEELNIKKIKNEKSNLKLQKKKKDNEKAQAFELSGKFMRGKKNNCLYKYLFGVEFTVNNEVELSVVYDTYFTLKNNNLNYNVDKDELINEFNAHIWPYVIEQIYSLLAKMNIEGDISIPPYGVIMNGQ